MANLIQYLIQTGHQLQLCFYTALAGCHHIVGFFARLVVWDVFVVSRHFLVWLSARCLLVRRHVICFLANRIW